MWIIYYHRANWHQGKKLHPKNSPPDSNLAPSKQVHQQDAEFKIVRWMTQLVHFIDNCLGLHILSQKIISAVIKQLQNISNKNCGNTICKYRTLPGQNIRQRLNQVHISCKTMFPNHCLQWAKILIKKSKSILKTKIKRIDIFYVVEDLDIIQKL